jgi:nicotinamide mononucleotide transporter
MHELLTQLSLAWASTGALEAAAAALGFAYVVLAIRQHRLCWAAAFVSTLLYTWVFWTAGLAMQAALQTFYVATAVWGWFAWRGRDDRGAPPVRRASWRVQLAGAALIALATAASAEWLGRATGSTQPVLDSLTTWASAFTTWMVVRKYLENWAWWFAIDALIAVLCWRQGLYASALLYGAFLVLVVVGWREWHRDWRRDVARVDSA